MRKFIFVFIFYVPFVAYTKTHIVGLDNHQYQYTTVTSAALVAEPGDTIMITGGIYPGGEYIENLKGSKQEPIVIMAESGKAAIFRGGSQAFHFVEPENLIIDRLVFDQQTGNGMNIDDGGTYDTPAKNIIIKNCFFMSMNATGNNDELKLSGVDNFVIHRCTFMNGSAGGSMVDMVGCHFGEFTENHFENAGSNCIQAKGGTSNIIILRNKFIKGGLRTINIGGSTGLQFFRPLDVDYEAQYIYVGANIFIGSQAPIAFVGAVNCIVTNNTFINPDKWAVRILQENVNGFQPCGNNMFVNNICYLNNSNPLFTLNIGSSTAPETFSFANNLWYNFENENWQGPDLPVEETNGIVGENPKFYDSANLDFELMDKSPAIGKGFYNSELGIPPEYDFDGNAFANPPSIGAFEYLTLDVDENIQVSYITIFPNPASEYIEIIADVLRQAQDDRHQTSFDKLRMTDGRNDIKIYNIFGECVINVGVQNLEPLRIDLSGLPNGIYTIILYKNQVVTTNKFVILK